MLPITRRSSVLAVLLLSAAGPAFSETVFQLKNGDRITGKILSEDTNQVVVATSWSEKLAVPLSQIEKRLEAIPPAATNAPVAAATNAPASSKTNAPTVAVSPPATPIKPKGPKQWNFDIQAGVSLSHNQKDSEIYTGVAKANYASPFMRDLLEYRGDYGRADGVVAANNMNGSWRIEHDVSKDRRAYLFNSVGAAYDTVRKLDISYEDSIGVGYKLIQKTTFALSLDSGVNYQEEFFADKTRKNFFSLQAGDVIGWSITPRLGLDQKLEYYPRITDGDGFRIRGEVNITYKLNTTGTVYLNGSVIDVYDKNPPAGITPNDLQVRSTIGLKF